MIYLQHDEFFEISYIFFNKAPDDLKLATKLRDLVETL